MDRMARAQSSQRYVYNFNEGGKDQKDLLGGKGANLAEMTNLGLPVPPGFTITTEACRAYLASAIPGERGQIPDGLAEEVAEHLAALEQAMGRRLGDAEDPLLVSVRSGARFSMPGMMETVLNVGLNDESVRGLARQSGNARFAWDSYRRLLQMFGRTVLGVDGDLFEEALEAVRGKKLGDPDDPLLVSVRSGAKFSMPGMMETVLNVGLNDASVHGLAAQFGLDYVSCSPFRIPVARLEAGRVALGQT